jgi:hypothetical protein
MFGSCCGLNGHSVGHSRQRSRVCRWAAVSHSYSGEVVRWREDGWGGVFKVVQGRAATHCHAARHCRSVSGRFGYSRMWGGE